MQNERPRKLQRISQACDLCHRRSIRCRPSNEDQDRCQNCYDFDVACTYDRPSKRRKHPQAPSAPRDSAITTVPYTTASSSNANAPLGGPTTALYTLSNPQPTPNASNIPSTANVSSTGRTPQGGQGGLPDHVEITGNVSPANARIDLSNRTHSGKQPDHGALVMLRPIEAESMDVSWKAFALASSDTVSELLDIYMQIIYPLYPLLDEPRMRRRLEQKDHLVDRGFFAAVMAACALTSARVRDGAFSGHISEDLRRPEFSSEIFFTAAKESLPSDFGKMGHVDYIRACTLLSLTCIQYGQSMDVQQYLGNAFTLAAMQRFYDEKYWPANLDHEQKELYRRVYWCTYMLDVYSAVVWSCFLRSQEIHSYVRYPSEATNNLPRHVAAEVGQPPSWLVGWNFALDLYRVLEHVVNKARARKFTHDDRRSVDSLVFSDSFSDRDVMQTMLNMYYELPRQFKETPPMTGDFNKDVYGFQAANIQATLQLLRMILFSLEDGPGVERKCDVANEVLQVFHTIPVPYLRAISTPLVYQLGSIGQILGSVLEEPLTQHVYERIRTALILMADLLENLELALHRSAGAAQGLRSQVKKLDEYMVTQRKTPQQPSARAFHPSTMAMGINTTTGLAMPGLTPLLGPQQAGPEMHADWPWQFFEEGNYFPGYGAGGNQY